MKKKIFLGIILILLVGLVGFVYGSRTEKEIPGYGVISGEYVEMSARVFPGWNLIYFFPNPDWINSEAISSDNVKAIYWYDPLNKEYLMFYPNPDPKIKETNVKFEEGSAFWVYLKGIDKNGVDIKYMTLKQPTMGRGIYLLNGWNFVGVTPDMIGRKINYIKNDCNILKSYGWDPIGQQWVSIMDTSFDDEGIGMGFVVKVEDSCKLGIPGKLGSYTSLEPRYEDESCNAEGTLCQKTTRLEYQDDATNKIVFVLLMDITKGTKSLFKDYATEEMGRSLETAYVNYNKLYRLEPAQLFWFVDDDKLDIIMTHEAKKVLNSAGSYSFNYETAATGDNAVTKYWLSKYPSVEVD